MPKKRVKAGMGSGENTGLIPFLVQKDSTTYPVLALPCNFCGVKEKMKGNKPRQVGNLNF